MLCLHRCICHCAFRKQDFRKQPSLATRIIASDPGAGTFMMSPILALVKGLGWREAFFVMAGLLVVVCFLGCAFNPNTPKGSSERDRCESKQGVKKEVNCQKILNTY